mmetsp:Transcript_6648/g.19504  ORF Transcript_6648/g.19504 Transcript_6648/m.19504 type:complete len:306 (+) Transcript_6648:266-1183(+)
MSWRLEHRSIIEGAATLPTPSLVVLKLGTMSYVSSCLAAFESHIRMWPSEMDLNSSIDRVLTKEEPLAESLPSSTPSFSFTCCARASRSFSLISGLRFCCLRIFTPKSILSSLMGSPCSSPKSVSEPPPSLSLIFALLCRMLEKNCLCNASYRAMSIPSTSMSSSMSSSLKLVSHWHTLSQNLTAAERSSRKTTACPPLSLTSSAIASAWSRAVYRRPADWLPLLLVTTTVRSSIPASLRVARTSPRSLSSQAYTNVCPPSDLPPPWAKSTSSAIVVFLVPLFPMTSMDWPTPTGTMASTAFTPV